MAHGKTATVTIDWYTVLAWRCRLCNSRCNWLAQIQIWRDNSTCTKVWVVFNAIWPTWSMEISGFFKGHWQSICTAVKAGQSGQVNCLPLWLCKETVKESRVSPSHTACLPSKRTTCKRRTTRRKHHFIVCIACEVKRIAHFSLGQINWINV